jgi:hypothetical protein
VVEIKEKRKARRFDWAGDIRLGVVPSVDLPEQRQLALRSIAENISEGGVGLISDWLPPPDAVLRCEFPIVDSPVFIATLLKLRWSQKMEGKRQYKLGLQFLL